MKFTKMEGAGNDYVYVDGFQERVKDAVAASIKVSHRHFGIGADGLIIIQPTEDESVARMEMYNADGSSSEMCGNGLRCVAKFVFDYGYAKGAKNFSLQTGDGLKGVEVIPGKDGLVESVIIDMGEPGLEGPKIPTTWNENLVLNEKLMVANKIFDVTCVSMGNPHCVIFVDDVKNFPVEKYGPLIENDPRFPQKVNVEFVEVISKTEFIQRTWERGSGETWACGTGASAVCVAGVLTGKGDGDVLIHLLGGDLKLNWNGLGNPVIMTGPTKEVFSGEINL